MATSTHVTIAAAGVVSDGPVGLGELLGRYSGQLDPERDGCTYIELIVEIELDPQSRLVNLEETPEP